MTQLATRLSVLGLTLLVPLAAVAEETGIGEPKWLPVRDVVGTPGRATFSLNTPTGRPRSRALTFVAVRGLVPVAEQEVELGKLVGKGAEVQAKLFVQDFECERQRVTGTAAKPRYGKWTPVDVELAIRILDASPKFAKEPAAEWLIDPTVTMPLPPALQGSWKVLGTHPKTTEKSGTPPATGVRLFRYVDFDVEPGQQWRYRVRLEVVNPLFGVPAERLADPESSKGRTRRTPWSEPSDPASVPRATRRQ